MTHHHARALVVFLCVSFATGSAQAASRGQPAADRGAALFRAGDFVGARDAFSEAIRLDPGLVNAWESLGWAEHRLGHDGEARRIWNELLRVYPAREETLDALAALDGQGTTRAAARAPRAPARRIQFAKATRMSRADDRAAVRSEAVNAFQAGSFDDAVASYERALALDGQDQAALRDLGWAHRKAGRPAEAEKVWRRYAAAFPRLAEPHDLLARLHLDRHAYAKALTESRASLAIDPRQKGAIIRTVHALLGLTRIEEGRRMAAELAARLPDDPQAQRLLATALTRSRDFREAARQWRRALDLEPQSALVRQNWVRALYDAGEADEGIAEARRLAASGDAPTAVLELLAQDAVARNDFVDAASWYRELTRREPDQHLYWRERYMMLERLGRYEEQVTVAREALRRMPDRAELQLDLATALGNVGRYDEAIERTRRYVRAFPDGRAGYQWLVNVLSSAGELSDALAVLSRSAPSFYKEYEQRIIEASLRVRMNDFRSAARLLDAVARPPPGQRHVPILLYHGIVESPRTLQTSAAAFESHVAALASHGYHPITMTELARMIDGLIPFPPRPVAITFDDARTDSFELADPVLARHGFKATMFVPTGRVRGEDGFHVGWDTLARHAGTGRWDLQAHGHDAHDLIPIDGKGRKGEYLVYRAWLADERRPETTAEYLRRLDGDYRQCKTALEDRLGGRTILAYAYPYNQVGQLQVATDGVAGANEVIASRHFRFGMIQEDSGYNTFVPGEKPPFMLRRFEVPRDWTGLQLLTHLARQEPSRVARAELARLTLAEGRPQAARRMIERIAREEPVLARAYEETLAEISWEENRPREAAAHLASAARSPPAGVEHADRLANRIAWRNDPRAGVESSYFIDSDGRSVRKMGASLHWPFSPPIDLELHAGELRIEESRLAALAGPDVSVGAAAALGRHVDVTGWGRWRALSDLPRSIDGGAGVGLRRDQHAVALGWSHEDVETVLAARKQIDRQVASATYQFESWRWHTEGRFAHLELDDGNRRDDLHATVLRRFGAEGRWGVGGSVVLEDSRFDPVEYYAPQQLVEAMARVTYHHTWRGSFSLAADAGVGAARDLLHAVRPGGRAWLRLSRWWGSKVRFGTTLGLEGTADPGYRSGEAELRFEGRL
jgi:tetratricopeptide (TPR) repeat protein/peptidoglycan/xylan/chitin deacetylase (PgdA/CDA1 family)